MHEARQLLRSSCCGFPLAVYCGVLLRSWRWVGIQTSVIVAAGSLASCMMVDRIRQQGDWESKLLAAGFRGDRLSVWALQVSELCLPSPIWSPGRGDESAVGAQAHAKMKHVSVLP